MKTYTNMYYSEGEMTLFKPKQCTVLVYEDRIEIRKLPVSAYLIGGALGLMVVSSVEGKIAASGTAQKPPAVNIPYSSIASYSKGKLGANKTIVIRTTYGQTYSIALANYRDEVTAIIESRR